MTDFFIDGERKEIDEGHVTFTVYGSFIVPGTEHNLIIVRMPSGKVAWSKKIVPAIQKLLKPWFPAYCRTARDRFWNVDGEGPIFVGKNFYSDTKKPIPETGKRLWDMTKFNRYEWDGENLIKID